ncbi:MAG: helix-hairpin-helix domain-containing protein [Candidatus Paceibacterota bacterium]|jgi:hypothetical protein
MPKDNPIIAERDVIAVEKRSGSKKTITIEIFLPQPTKDGKDCFCLARFNGIEGESYNVGGVDSLQALSIAISRIKSRFTALKSEKYDFLWPENGEPVESIDYDFVAKGFRHQPERSLDMDPECDLQKIPGVGESIAWNLLNIGINSIADLKGKDPEKLYEQSNHFAGITQDRCLLYVFREAVYFAETKNPDPKKLKWWYWKNDPR